MSSAPQVPGYRIGALIARGGSASVWAATTSGGEDDLAVKVVPLGGEDDGERLCFELAALSATRTGEHLVEVRDVVAVTEPGPAVAIVMPRLHHGTLARLVGIRGHLTPGEVITVVTPVALALAELHDGAVVHGDLSAANVGFDELGRPVVLDLGVAGIIGSPRELVYGTPGFLAPEIVAGGPHTPAGDVYGLGALGWFALTGEPPEIPADRRPLRELLPDVPEQLAEALERALHPDPALRGDARSLATMAYGSGPAKPVQPVAGEDPALMLTHRVRGMAAVDERAPDETRSDRRAALRSRRRASHLRVLATLVVALLLGGGGLTVAHLSRGESAPLAPATQPRSQPTAVAVEVSAPMDYRGLVQDLVDSRAAAWTSADPARLDDAFAPGSGLHASDAALITEAAAQGHTYADLAFAVEDLQVLTESADRLTIRATLTTSGYAVRTRTAAVTSVEERAGSSSQVVLTLARVDDGISSPQFSEDAWRILEVTPVDG